MASITTYIAIILSSAAIGLTSATLLTWLLRGRKTKTVEEYNVGEEVGVSVRRYSREEDARRASERLRVLEAEREALGQLIASLYEAEDYGRITHAERERIAKRYLERLKEVNEEIGRNRLIISLYELEKTRDELMKTFRQRIAETQRRINEIRSRLRPTPVKPIPPAPARAKKPAARKEAPKKPRLEEEVRRLREEVLKELEELEKLELEA